MTGSSCISSWKNMNKNLNVERLMAQHGLIDQLALDEEFLAHLLERATYV
jgi:hypothetical protein